MLAAHEIGLATCPIGLARPWLNLPEAKKEIGIPEGLKAVFPVILGYPREVPHPHGRKNPEIALWKE
jgi:nitroreductase